jgi:hypothetical protein
MAAHRPALASLLLAGSIALAACAAEADGEPVALARASTSTTDPTTTTTAPPTTTTAQPTTTTAPPVDVFALRPPAPPADPAALVQQIAESEAVLRDAAAPPEAVGRAALAHQVAYRTLGLHPEWDAAVVPALPEHLRRIVELHAAARREFRAMHSRLPTNMPPWQIVPPPPAEVLLASYREAEATFGIPWRYLAAINLVETGIGRIRGTSSAGAQGPMQFMPATWAAYGAGGDVNDPHDAIMGAARYLAANNGAADIDHALYRYNHSNRYVLGVKLYADLIAEHPQGFRAFYHWGIWYATELGDVYLPVGYHETAPVPVAEYLARG